MKSGVQENKGLQWENVKQKSLRQTEIYSRIFRHIETCSSIISSIQELFRYILTYSEPCVTLAYSKTLVYSEPEAVSKLWHIQKPLKHRP